MDRWCVWGEKKNEGWSLCKVFLIRKKKEALYANLLTCVFSASATLVLCKRKVTFFFPPASVLWNGSSLLFEAPVSVLRIIGISSLVYIMLCNVFSVSFSSNFVSITPNHFFFFLFWKKTANRIHFICRLE